MHGRAPGVAEDQHFVLSWPSRGWQLTATQLACEPRSSQPPVAHHSLRGHLEDFRRFVHAESAKESQLNDLRAPRIDLCQRLERVVQRAERDGRFRVVGHDAVQVDVR
jgi:hypothetical protein